MTRTSPLSRLAYRVRRPLARHWVTYAPAVRLRGRRGELLVRGDSALCLEGYPRSGNTLAHASLLVSNPDVGHVAHHLHAPAQVARAVSLGVPTLVVVRPARDCVASLMVRGRAATARELVEDHIDFHARAVRLVDSLAIVSFSDVVADPGCVEAALNQRFGLGLTVFQDGPDSRAAVERLVRRMDRRDPEGRGERTVALPSEARADETRRLREVIEQTTEPSLLDRADELVGRLLRSAS